MTLSYKFKNGMPGSADGTITVELCNEKYSPDAKITLYWGAYKDGEAVHLTEYTPIVTLDTQSASSGYIIDKELCFPLGATAVIATVTDGDITDTVTLDIPADKKAKDRGDPLYTVGFASDFHIGGWGSDAAPKEGLIKARDEFNKLVDFLITEGDLIQWHGCYSGEEFKKYNFDGKNWGDNGERSPEFVGIGRSQWTMLEEYLAGFTIPVYHCQGNHDIIDEERWSPMCGNQDYFGDFLTKWIKQSEDSGKYENRIRRDESVHYYEAIIKEHKFVFTEAPHPHPPHHTIGKTELSWLDKVLFDGEESGKPIFVMGHSPIDPRLNKKTAYANFTDLTELKRIFEKHPTVIYVSGHSHFTLDTPLRNAIDGRQDHPSHLHNGGMTTTIDPPPMTQYNVTHGTVAEVYEDGILLRGRNCTTGEWISLANSEMIFKKPCHSGNIWIEKGEDGEDVKLSARSDNTQGICFEWYLDGELISFESSISLPSDTKGYIALRARDLDGGFRSVIYNSIKDI